MAAINAKAKAAKDKLAADKAARDAQRATEKARCLKAPLLKYLRIGLSSRKTGASVRATRLLFGYQVYSIFFSFPLQLDQPRTLGSGIVS